MEREKLKACQSDSSPPNLPPNHFCILHSVQVASWHFTISTQAYDASLPDEGYLLLPRLIMIIVMMITIITNFPCRSCLACRLHGRTISCIYTLCGDVVVAWGVCVEQMDSVLYMCVSLFSTLWQCNYFIVPHVEFLLSFGNLTNCKSHLISHMMIRIQHDSSYRVYVGKFLCRTKSIVCIYRQVEKSCGGILDFAGMCFFVHSSLYRQESPQINPKLF